MRVNKTKNSSFSFKSWYSGMNGCIGYSGDTFMSFTLCNLFISFTHVQLKKSLGLITLDKRMTDNRPDYSKPIEDDRYPT